MTWVIDVLHRINKQRPNICIMLITIEVLHSLQDMFKNDLKVLTLWHRWHPKYSIILMPPIQNVLKEYPILEPEFVSFLKRYHGKQPIPAIGCLLVDFNTPDIMALQDSPSILIIYPPSFSTVQDKLCMEIVESYYISSIHSVYCRGKTPHDFRMAIQMEILLESPAV